MGTAVLFGCGSTSGGGSVVPPGTHVLTIHFTGNGGGQVHSSSPFDCSGECTKDIAGGSSITLTATADAGSAFAGWSGACSGTDTCALTMDADREVTASFSRLPPGSALVKLEFAGKGTGHVRSSPAGIDCPGACSMTLPSGTNISFTAQADTGSNFVGWGGACSGPGVCSFNASGDQTVWADFEPKSPPGSSCTGISPPDSPARLSFVANTPLASFNCGSAAGDAGGMLSFARHFQDPNNHTDHLDFVRSDGAVLGTASTNQGLSPLQQPVGLSAVAGAPYLGPLANHGSQLVNFDAAGKASGETFLFGQKLPSAADPGGGVLVAGDFATSVIDPTTHAPTPAGPVAHSAAMFTGGGSTPTLRWGPKALASSGTVLGLGVDLAGRSLIITDGAPRFGAGAISGQWFDADGTDLTGEFALISGFVPGAATWFETSPLIGSGLLVRRIDGGLHAQALLTVTSGKSSVQAAPDWMRARTDTRLQIARGGRAYAVLPFGAAGVACSQRVEVVAPDGTSCGATDFPIATGTCDTHDLALGADGTVIQQLPDSMETKDDIHAFHTCTWRWWAAAAK